MKKEEEQLKKEEEPKVKKKIPYNVITGILVVIVLVAGFFVYIRPVLERSRLVANKDINQLEQEVILKESKLLSIKKFARALDELPTDTHSQLQDVLPDNPNEVDLLANIVGLVESVNLQLEQVDVAVQRTSSIAGQQKNETVSVGEVRVDINVDGLSYTVLRNFLENVEHNVRMMRVDNFSFDPRRPDGAIILTAFYLE